MCVWCVKSDRGKMKDEDITVVAVGGCGQIRGEDYKERERRENEVE